MKTIKLLGCIFLLSLYSHAQVGVGTTSPNATLDITASNVSSPTANDGILIPRIDNFPSTNPTADQNGMMVFVTGNGTPVKGFYYWDNGVNTWIKIDNETGWSLIGNSGTNSATNFIGTTDNESLVFRTNNTEKLRLTEKGQLEINNTGRSIFIGNNAGENDDLSLNDNTFVGNNSGFNNTTGANNSFLGSDSGLSNTTGINNTFVGSNSGSSNTTANNNSFFGLNSGELNTTGFDNSFFGSFSGSNNTNGRWNSFYGALAGSNNTTGNNNSFFGRNTGYQNTTGINNSFFGLSAGTDNTSGSNNVAVGLLALSYNVTGDSNVAIGYSAGLGATANSKSGGVFIGNEAGRNENNDNRLYIDNTATNSPLIYGEFDSNIVRINGELQVNNPTTTGYILPNTDGTVGQVMTTDGSGNVTFQDVVGDGDTQNTLDQAYDEGGPGAGRTINALDGAVEIAGRDGFQVTGTYGNGDAVLLSGAGTRLFFNPNKAAFRAGVITGNEWDDTNVGEYSVAFGENTVASAAGTVAFGENTEASGNWATAFGATTIASGNYSIAGGNLTTASDFYTTAFGQNTTASERGATAFGFSTVASGRYAAVFGRNNTAGSYGETVIGLYSNEITPIQIASFDANDQLFVVGNGTSNSDRSNALTIYKSGRMNINDAYNMPTTDGTTGQVMTTDGAGNVTFEDISAGDTDWVVQSTSNQASAVTDNLYTDGTVKIGGTNGATGGAKLEVINANQAGGLAVVNTSSTAGISIQNQNNVPNYDKILLRNLSIVNNTGGTSSNLTGVLNDLSSNVNGGIISGVQNSLTSGLTTASTFYGLLNETSTVNTLTSAHGMFNLFRHNSTNTYGVRNQHLLNGTNFYGISNEANGSLAYGAFNSLSASSSYGSFSDISGNGTGSKYGHYVNILSTAGGDHYGYYSDVRKSTGYAAYFVGRTSLGFYPTVNRYVMPLEDGTAGQVMTTNGAGDVTFQDLPAFTDTDEQDLGSSVVTANEEVEISITNGTNTTINIQDADANASNELITSAVLNGTDLEITEAGSTTTVDLSAINSDEQDLSSTVTTPNEEVEISITNGTNTTINIQDADANASNELITSAILNGTDLEITEAGSTTTVNLAALQDGVGAQQINDLIDGKSDNDGTQNGSSIYLGIDAGGNDDETNNQNVGIGYRSLRSNTSGQNNTAIGHNTMFANTSGNDNVAIGENTLAASTTESNDVAIGSSTLQIKTVGNGNVAIGYSAGRNDVTSSFNTYIGYQAGGASLTSSIAENKVGNIFLGYNAGFDENGSNKLYIENSDSSTPLIYGEFDNDILRANGELQVGDPTTTGFAFPTSDGTNGQVMTTDGSGVVSFQDLPTFTDTDEQDIQNLSLDASNILTVGIENGASDTVDLSSLKDADWYEVGTTNSPDSITDNIFTEGNVGIGTSTIGAHTTSSQTLTIGPNDTTSSVDASYIELVGLATPNQTVAGIHFDSGTPTGDGIARIEARLNSSTQFAGHLLFLTGNSSGNLTEKMRIEDNGDIGIGITNPDTRLHVSGDFKLQNGSEAIGRVLSTNNQGLSSWVDPATVFTDTDDQDLGSSIVTPNEEVEISITNGSNTTINIQDADANSSNELITAAVLNGTDLEITEAGSTTSVDLSSLNPVKSVARITMSASQTETGAGTTKVNFDTVDFDINSNFNTTADRFVVPADGLYRVTTQITMDTSTGTGIFAVRVRVNGTQERRSEFNHHGNGQVVRQVTSILNLTAGQTLDVSFSHPSIGATILANGRGTFFEIEQL